MKSKSIRVDTICDLVASSLVELINDYTTKDIFIDTHLTIINHICTFKIPGDKSFLYLSYNPRKNTIALKASGYSALKVYNVMYDLQHDDKFTVTEFKLVCEKIVKINNMR